MKRSYRILVVDDQVLIRMMIAESFRDDGHKVFEAANGQEAIALLDTKTIDAIVMDLQMPLLDGMEATRLIKQNPCFSPIAIFAFSGGPIVHDFQPELFAGVLYKPLGPDSVRQAVLTFLNERTQTENRYPEV